MDVLLVDAGILGGPLTEPDVTRQEVAAAGGADVEALAEARDRSAAIEAMSRGVAEVVLGLHAKGCFDAIGALGGTGGTALATHAMQRLPIGVPKLMVSTAASGDTQRYFGPVDVTMMYSVVDIAGLNSILTGILGNAAGALVGMATRPAFPPGEGKPLIVASMFGVTTPCVTVARERLEELGYEVLVFHQVGLGGQSLEEVVKAGGVAGVLDVTRAGWSTRSGAASGPKAPSGSRPPAASASRRSSRSAGSTSSRSARRSRCPPGSPAGRSTSTTTCLPRRGPRRRRVGRSRLSSRAS